MYYEKRCMNNNKKQIPPKLKKLVHGPSTHTFNLGSNVHCFWCLKKIPEMIYKIAHSVLRASLAIYLISNVHSMRVAHAKILSLPQSSQFRQLVVFIW